MTIKHIFVTHLDTAPERWEKFKNNDSIIKWSAREQKTMINDITEEEAKRMISMWNLPRNKHLAKCGITLSHYKLYKYIIENKLNDVLILEDDALLVGNYRKDYPSDRITYIGGFFHQNKMMDSSPVTHVEHKDGINYPDGTYSIMMTLSYIIPTYEIARQLVEYLDGLKRWRSIDIMVWKSPLLKAYVYPAVYVEEETPSTLRNKSCKSNIHYQLVKWNMDYFTKQ